MMKLTVLSGGYDISDFPEEIRNVNITDEDLALSPDEMEKRASPSFTRSSAIAVSAANATTARILPVIPYLHFHLAPATIRWQRKPQTLTHALSPFFPSARTWPSERVTRQPSWVRVIPKMPP